jgi:hypothetical protein
LKLTLVLTGPDLGGYHHELFLRGRPELTRGIQRLRIKGCGPRRGRRDEIVTPDHYAMPFLPVPGTGSTGANVALNHPLAPSVVSGETFASTPVLLLSSTLVPLIEQLELRHASAVASLTETTLGAEIGRGPSPHDWAKLLHWRRALLLERQELVQQQQRLLASTLETRRLDIVRALTLRAELATAASQGFVSGLHLDNPDALTMRSRHALVVALLENLNNV